MEWTIGPVDYFFEPFYRGGGGADHSYLGGGGGRSIGTQGGIVGRLLLLWEGRRTNYW